MSDKPNFVRPGHNFKELICHLIQQHAASIILHKRHHESTPTLSVENKDKYTVRTVVRQKAPLTG